MGATLTGGPAGAFAGVFIKDGMLYGPASATIIGPFVWFKSSIVICPTPDPPLTGVLSDPRVLAFLAVWFGINILFGLGSLPIPGAEANQVVAWQAHIGGFLAGLFLFSWFDPAPDFQQFDDLGATRH